MSIVLSVALLPVVVLACRQANPAEQLPELDFRSLMPVLDVVDDLVSFIVGKPSTLPSFPLSFFERMLPSIWSEITSLLAMSCSPSSVTMRSAVA